MLPDNTVAQFGDEKIYTMVTYGGRTLIAEHLTNGSCKQIPRVDRISRIYQSVGHFIIDIGMKKISNYCLGNFTCILTVYTNICSRVMEVVGKLYSAKLGTTAVGWLFIGKHENIDISMWFETEKESYDFIRYLELPYGKCITRNSP